MPEELRAEGLAVHAGAGIRAALPGLLGPRGVREGGGQGQGDRQQQDDPGGGHAEHAPRGVTSGIGGRRGDDAGVARLVVPGGPGVPARAVVDHGRPAPRGSGCPGKIYHTCEVRIAKTAESWRLAGDPCHSVERGHRGAGLSHGRGRGEPSA